MFELQPGWDGRVLLVHDEFVVVGLVEHVVVGLVEQLGLLE